MDKKRSLNDYLKLNVSIKISIERWKITGLMLIHNSAQIMMEKQQKIHYCFYKGEETNSNRFWSE